MEWGGSDYYVPGGNTITVPDFQVSVKVKIKQFK